MLFSCLGILTVTRRVTFFHLINALWIHTDGFIKIVTEPVASFNDAFPFNKYHS